MTICLMRWTELCMMHCQLSRELLNQIRYPAYVAFILLWLKSKCCFRLSFSNEVFLFCLPCALFFYIYKIQVVAGGGAVEAALSVYLEYLATTLGSREQLAIAEFAESLLIIPKVSYKLN